jgi:hypothetical protein
MQSVNLRQAEPPEEMPGMIPLDLSQALPSQGQFAKLAIRVGQLPPGAILSRGKNNGDGSWSLRPDQLDGLLYSPPEGYVHRHVLHISVLGLDGEVASTLVDFEQPVGEASRGAAALHASSILAAKGNAAPAPAQVSDVDGGDIPDIRDAARALSDTMACSLRNGMASERPEHWAESAGDVPPASDERAAVDEAIRAARAEAEQAAERKLAAQIRDLNEALATARAVLGGRDGEIVAARLEARQAVRAELAGEVRSLKEALAARDKEIESARSDVKRTTTLEGQVRALTDELAEARSVSAEYQQAIETACADTERSVRAELDGQVRALKDKLSKATVSLASRDEDMAAARADAEQTLHATLDDHTRALADELDAAKAALAQHGDEIETARAETEQAVRAELDGRLRALAEELAATKTSLVERDQELAAARVEAEWTAHEICKELDDRIRAATEAEPVATERPVGADLEAAQDAAIEAARQEAEASVRAELDDQIQELTIELAAAHALLEVSDGTEAPEASLEVTTTPDGMLETLIAQSAEQNGDRQGGKTGRAGRVTALAASILIGIGVFVAWSEIERTITDLWIAVLPAAEMGEMVFVGESAANLRAGPSMTQAVVSVVAAGAVVEKLEGQGAWIRIRVAGEAGQPGVEGWMHESVVKPPS